MPHVSRIKLDQKVERELVRTLGFVLTRLNKEEEMDKFLFSLMTPTERLMLGKRLAAIILLKENLADIQISHTLKLTRETIARIRMIFEIRGGGYDLALNKLQNEKVINEIKGVLKSLASYAIKAAGGRV